MRGMWAVGFGMGIMAGLAIGVPIGVLATKPEPTMRRVVKAKTTSIEHLAWCDRIYHRNVGCPKYGQVEVPQEVLDKEAERTAIWCENIGHINVSCPMYQKRN